MENGNDHMIYKLDNALLIPKVLTLARALPDPNLPALEGMIIKGIGRKDAALFVDEKAEEVNGFIFATVEEFEGEDAVFIQASVIKPNNNHENVGHELLARVRAWGRARGLKQCYFMTRRSARAYERKYGFRYHTTVLKRSL